MALAFAANQCLESEQIGSRPFLSDFLCNFDICNLFAEFVLLGVLSLEVRDETVGFAASDTVQELSEWNETADEVLIVSMLIHLLLGEEDLDAALALAPEAVGLAQFGVVEVDLPHEEQPHCAQVERFGIDQLHLLDLERVADRAFLLRHLSQLLQERNGSSEQLGNSLRGALPAAVDVVRVGKDHGVAVDKNVHLHFGEQQRDFLQDL